MGALGDTDSVQFTRHSLAFMAEYELQECFGELPGTTIIGMVKNTLFSGDPLTQLINTLMNMILTYSVIGEDGEASVKGDDAVIISKTEGGAGQYVEEKSANGVIIAPDKTIISLEAVEMERCEVNESGFDSSLLRKVGSTPIAEPQGEANLTVREHYTSAIESGGSLLLRGAEDEGVVAYVKARLRSNGIHDEVQIYM